MTLDFLGQGQGRRGNPFHPGLSHEPWGGQGRGNVSLTESSPQVFTPLSGALIRDSLSDPTCWVCSLGLLVGGGEAPGVGQVPHHVSHSSPGDWDLPASQRVFPGGSEVKNPPANAGDAGLFPGLGRKWQRTPVFLPGESHEQRSLEGCSLWGRKK